MYSSERRRDRTIRKETVITEPAMDGSDGCMQRTWRATFLVPLSSVLIRGSRDGCAGGCSPGSVRVPTPGSGPGPDPWATLLWANGRMDLPGGPRQASWRWHCAPLA
jgi:hypothetical protein